MSNLPTSFRSSFLIVCLAAVLLMASSQLFADKQDARESKQSNPNSPVRGIERDFRAVKPRARQRLGFRTIDGFGNNVAHPEYNATDTSLKRRMTADYSDYVAQMSGLGRPAPRDISNAVADQSELRYNSLGFTDFLWQWGQFLDHDIDLTDGSFPAESTVIFIPAGDPHFDPQHTGTQVMPFNRSAYDPATGTGPENPRQQMNQITGWIDASNVYGSDDERASVLRTNDGTGRLRMSEGRLLPFNSEGLPNAGGSSDRLFLAGDVRANEQVGLTALHTLFLREHNRLAAIIAKRRNLSGDEIYERARRIVGAQMQAITYNEFLPALLGDGALSSYAGYDSEIDPRIMNEFSTGAYRLGHSLLNPELMRVDRNNEVISSGNLPLRNAFFAPDEVIDHGISSILRGLAMQRCQELDVFIIDDVRNFLFGAPGHGGFDLASLNIQRGRDHGLPSYNESRETMGMAKAESFADITEDAEIQQRLASVYDSPDEIDLWVGGLAEDKLEGSLVGELFFTILKRQFEVLRDGDRFWYERTLHPSEMRFVRTVRLSHIIRRNTKIGTELPRDVFRIQPKD